MDTKKLSSMVVTLVHEMSASDFISSYPEPEDVMLRAIFSKDGTVQWNCSVLGWDELADSPEEAVEAVLEAVRHYNEKQFERAERRKKLAAAPTFDVGNDVRVNNIAGRGRKGKITRKVGNFSFVVRLDGVRLDGSFITVLATDLGKV